MSFFPLDYLSSFVSPALWLISTADWLLEDHLHLFKARESRARWWALSVSLSHSLHLFFCLFQSSLSTISRVGSYLQSCFLFRFIDLANIGLRQKPETNGHLGSWFPGSFLYCFLITGWHVFILCNQSCIIKSLKLKSWTEAVWDMNFNNFYCSIILVVSFSVIFCL